MMPIRAFASVPLNQKEGEDLIEIVDFYVKGHGLSAAPMGLHFQKKIMAAFQQKEEQPPPPPNLDPTPAAAPQESADKKEGAPS